MKILRMMMMIGVFFYACRERSFIVPLSRVSFMAFAGMLRFRGRSLLCDHRTCATITIACTFLPLIIAGA